MDKYLSIFKAVVVSILTYVYGLVGGVDKALILLIQLIVFDVITGVVRAIMHKELSSSKMRDGLMCKVLIFVSIILGFTIDSIFGLPKEVAGIQLSFRMIFILYSCINEGISLIENLCDIGVPFPLFIKDILVQVKECTNKSTPKLIIKWLKNAFNIDVDKDVDENDSKHDSNKTDDENDNISK